MRTERVPSHPEVVSSRIYSSFPSGGERASAERSWTLFSLRRSVATTRTFTFGRRTTTSVRIVYTAAGASRRRVEAERAGASGHERFDWPSRLSALPRLTPGMLPAPGGDHAGAPPSISAHAPHTCAVLAASSLRVDAPRRERPISCSPALRVPRLSRRAAADSAPIGSAVLPRCARPRGCAESRRPDLVVLARLDLGNRRRYPCLLTTTSCTPWSPTYASGPAVLSMNEELSPGRVVVSLHQREVLEHRLDHLAYVALRLVRHREVVDTRSVGEGLPHVARGVIARISTRRELSGARRERRSRRRESGPA